MVMDLLGPSLEAVSSAVYQYALTTIVLSRRGGTKIPVMIITITIAMLIIIAITMLINNNNITHVNNNNNNSVNNNNNNTLDIF